MNPNAPAAHRLLVAVAGLALATTLGGCSGLSQALGFGKQSPDEFAVVRHERLAVPPKVDLRPPQPGAPRPQERPSSEIARAALSGGESGSAPARAAEPAAGLTQKTPGERSLLRETGAGESPVNIREVVRIEAATEGVQDRSLTDALLFWTGEPEQAEAVDPVAEVERLRREGVIAPDASTVTGASEEGLTIERKKGGILGNIFN